MATSKEVYEIIEMLLDAYPHYKPRNLERLVDTWARKFAGIDIEILQEAADLHLDASTFFPAVHDINAQLATAEYNILNRDAADLDKSALDEQARIDWENATDEARSFWSEMMEADGREMVSPGVWR